MLLWVQSKPEFWRVHPFPLAGHARTTQVYSHIERDLEEARGGLNAAFLRVAGEPVDPHDCLASHRATRIMGMRG